MTGPTRQDAVRNRTAVLAAADELFARRGAPEDVTMADVAAAAGVGKGTVFRAVGDRAGLLHALFEARLAPLVARIESGDAPLGPDTPAARRLPAVLDALLDWKLTNRRLALALETGAGGDPYRTERYPWWHQLVRGQLADLGVADPGFTAHVLLAATRADLLEHLVTRERRSRRRLRADLAALVERTVRSGPPGGPR